MLDQQETALGVFLDIEWAFNNTRYDTMCDALVRHGSEYKYTIVRWIRATVEDRVAVVTLGVCPRGSRYPGASRRGVCCHHFCGARW